jgi:hypothetical protein
MYDIKPLYSQYDDVFQEFGEKKIEKRYETLLSALNIFIKKMGYSEDVYVNETILMYSLLDYFTDIMRIKSFHKIEHVNEVKIIAYETYWLLKRKPLQIKGIKKEYAFVNERFAFSHITNFLSTEDDTKTKLLEGGSLDFFLNTLFYFLKYRHYDAQVIELMLLAFKAGETFQLEMSKSST